MTRRFRALVVHEQPEALGELSELVSGIGLAVDTARNATEALNRVRGRTAVPGGGAGAPHIILASHRPPGFDAVGFLESTIALAPEAMRIALVGAPDELLELDHRPAGQGAIMRFVARPSERSLLVALLGETVKLVGLVEDQRDLVRRLANEQQRLVRRETLLDVVVRERTSELEESYLKLKAANRQALFGLAEAIEAKDPYTKGHCGRVAAYSLVLAKESGYPDEGLETLEFGAFLHDIGKIGIRDAVLLKPGPLDETEWQHMREHPVKGYEIASKIEMLKPIMSAVRNHHERWDGTGYPDKLVAEQIPMAARIVAIADAYDAMATDRPYKRALAADECDAMLRKAAGKMYDPELIELFVQRKVGDLFRDEYGGAGL